MCLCICYVCIQRKLLLLQMYSLSISEGELLGEGKLIVKVVIFGGGDCCYFRKLWYNLTFSLPRYRVLELRKLLKWTSLTFSDCRSVNGDPKHQMTQVGQATPRWRWQSWQSDLVYCFDNLCSVVSLITNTCKVESQFLQSVAILTMAVFRILKILKNNKDNLSRLPNNQEFVSLYIFHPELWSPHKSKRRCYYDYIILLFWKKSIKEKWVCLP